MSGLPSGYTQLEYIQSSGTQYINSGFTPNQDTRVVAEFESLIATGGFPVFGSRQSGSTRTYTFGTTGTNNCWLSGYNNGSVNSGKKEDTARHIVDKNKAVCYLDGVAIATSTYATFTSPGALWIFRFYSGDGDNAAYGKLKLYACKVYDNGILARDFVPCKNASGAVGLYDTVSAQFYANAGTGTFTAGPEVVYEPDAPTNFAASVSGQTVALSWAAAANAAGYRLKRDGVQIAEQTGTTYTDTVPDGTTLCAYALTAYNDDGESAAVTLLVFVQLELVTDRTRADVANQTDKGFYNASDLNRVGAAVEYIAGRFTALGYDCPVTVKKDWLTIGAPTQRQMETYRQNIVTLRGQIAVMASTPDAPASMAGLDYIKANNIEQILLDLDALIDKIIKSWYFSGELYAGEV